MLNLRASYKLKENMFEIKEGLEKGMREVTKNLEEPRGLAK